MSANSYLSVTPANINSALHTVLQSYWTSGHKVFALHAQSTGHVTDLK